MLIAFIFDLFRIKRKTVKTNTVSVFIEDFLYWIISALVMFAMVYLTNDGELRGYIFTGTAIGAVLYMLVLSRLIIKASLKIIGITCMVFKALWNIFSYPFKFLIKLLSIPIIMLFNFLIRVLKKGKRIARSNFSKIKMGKRIFNNARKKI